MKAIFLSASIPVKERDERYLKTADVVAIRDSIIELVKICIANKIRIVWGGHPAITPLVYKAVELFFSNQPKMETIQEYIHLYQSRFFEKYFPEDNNKFNNVYLTDALDSIGDSLELMRMTMLKSETFSAGVFIGGMEGVEIEYKMFKDLHPDSPTIPVASTGAAAKLIYESDIDAYDSDLEDNYAYNSLFIKELLDKI